MSWHELQSHEGYASAPLPMVAPQEDYYDDEPGHIMRTTMLGWAPISPLANFEQPRRQARSSRTFLLSLQILLLQPPPCFSDDASTRARATMGEDEDIDIADDILTKAAARQPPLDDGATRRRAAHERWAAPAMAAASS